jgi:hypothetical protein
VEFDYLHDLKDLVSVGFGPQTPTGGGRAFPPTIVAGGSKGTKTGFQAPLGESSGAAPLKGFFFRKIPCKILLFRSQSRSFIMS